MRPQYLAAAVTFALFAGVGAALHAPATTIYAACMCFVLAIEGLIDALKVTP